MWGVTADRLFDGERFLEWPSLVVDGDAVVAVGEPAPPGARVTHLGDATLLPGLVDCHQHLVFDGAGTLEEQVRGSDEDLAARARVAARRALEGGVTTIRDLGDRSYVTLDLRGDPELPTILAAGPPITQPGGHCWYLGGEVSDMQALRAAVAERIDRGCDVVKVMVTGGAMTPTFPLWRSQFGPAEVRLVVELAHAAGLPVAAHCHGVDGIADAVAAGVDTIEHCTFFTEAMESVPPDELLDELAASDTALSATWGVSGPRVLPPHWEAAVPVINAAIGRVHARGGTVVVGTDAGITPVKPHDVLPHALPILLDVGMTLEQALASMTSVAAAVCGVPQRGRLAVGAPADVIAVRGDPGADPAALADIRAVWKDGREIVGPLE